ncbi:MAG: RlmE family RNA methyltransferase [Parvibaculales bacterium]
MSKEADGGRKGRIKTRVKTARGRKISSTRWLQRQLNDPYVEKAQKEGYRSRAAYKLTEMDDRFGFLKPGYRVVDLGCAPGGWLQVAVERTKALTGQGFVFGIDLLDIEPVQGSTFVKMDFLDDTAPQLITDMAGAELDTVLSDMAANVTGHRKTDHLRTIALAEAAAWFAFESLKPGGSFCAKVFQGGTTGELLEGLKKNFTRVVHMKPKASRKESVELYVIATGFRG